jgi:superfamily II DNA or RNA helicase
MSIVQLAKPLPAGLDLTEQDLKRSFSRHALDAGRDYLARGRVRGVAVTPDGSRIEAEVQGTAPTPYQQSILLRQLPDGSVAVHGRCTCPLREGCKHIAAVLLAARARRMRPATPQTSPAEAPLPADVAHWLHDLETAEKHDSEEFPPELLNRVISVLSGGESRYGQSQLAVSPFSVRLLKDGRLSSSGKLLAAYRQPSEGAQPRFYRPSDRVILARLARGVFGAGASESAEDTLRRIIATGRARWQNLAGPPVTEGEPKPGKIIWRLLPNGAQQPDITLEQEALTLLLPEPWYALAETGVVGPIQVDLPAPMVRRMLAAPQIPAEFANRVGAELSRRLGGSAVPAPREVPPPRDAGGPPVPVLRLMADVLPSYPGARARGRDSGLIPFARLEFAYGPVRIAPQDFAGPQRNVVQDGVLYRVRRSHEREMRARHRLAQVGFERVVAGYDSWGNHWRDRWDSPWSSDTHSGDFLPSPGGPEDAWAIFIARDVPVLRSEGWQIEIAPGFPVRVIEPEGDIFAALEEGSGIDWLELHLGVLVDGERVDLVPALVALIAKATPLPENDAEKLLLPLPGGGTLALPFGRVRPIVKGLMEMFAAGNLDAGAGRVGFSRFTAVELAALEQSAGGIVWQGGEALRDLGRRLRESGGSIPHVAVPPDFQGTLRSYQAQGLDWLQFLHGAGLGGVLADDMGLGKTIQTLAHLAVEKEAGRLTSPSLIVCPTSLVPNWTREAARFAPSLRLLALHGPQRKQHFAEIPANDVVLTTYPLLTRDHAVLTAQDWHIVALDEAQTIKNPGAETTRLASQLKAAQRICLSGTPLQNHLGELWSVFDFIAPGFLGSHNAFRTQWRTPIEKQGDSERLSLLARRIRPFILRRTKEEVATELPPKLEITESIELGSAQRSVYESIRLAMHRKVRDAIAAAGLARSGVVVLDALLKLRQACCDPRLLKLESAREAKAGSAKLDRLTEMLDVILAEERRVLIFSQFTTMLALIQSALAESRIPFVLLTGDTKDRATPVQRFQSGEVPVFLISLKAGGVGLNLTRADTVIHYDPWWNPAAEDQATDRAHRIGQDKRVMVHRLIALGTIEEKMELLKDKKRSLVDGILNTGRGKTVGLTEADIEMLFGPA